jgi:hypothetical protein
MKHENQSQPTDATIRLHHNPQLRCLIDQEIYHWSRQKVRKVPLIKVGLAVKQVKGYQRDESEGS